MCLLLNCLRHIIIGYISFKAHLNLQQTAAQNLVEVCKSASEYGLALGDIIQLLAKNLMSFSPVLRHSSLEGLFALIEAYPEEGSVERESLTSKVLLAKFDVQPNTKELAERYFLI